MSVKRQIPRILLISFCEPLYATGDTMEVVEDEEASEQVKKLRVTLASVPGQIEVS